jgi:hypothetical protein
MAMNDFLTMKPEGLTPLLLKIAIEYNHEPAYARALLGFSKGTLRAENLLKNLKSSRLWRENIFPLGYKIMFAKMYNQ